MVLKCCANYQNFLDKLICNNNKLTSLPSLPPTLSVLRCDYNEINELPEEIPLGLEKLYCYHNNIKKIT